MQRSQPHDCQLSWVGWELNAWAGECWRHVQFFHQMRSMWNVCEANKRFCVWTEVAWSLKMLVYIECWRRPIPLWSNSKVHPLEIDLSKSIFFVNLSINIACLLKVSLHLSSSLSPSLPFFRSCCESEIRSWSPFSLKVSQKIHCLCVSGGWITTILARLRVSLHTLLLAQYRIT